MTTEQVILKADDIDQILTKMARVILEKHRGAENLVLIGIRTGGVFLADRLKAKILSLEGADIPRGNLDINLYRDDVK